MHISCQNKAFILIHESTTLSSDETCQLSLTNFQIITLVIFCFPLPLHALYWSIPLLDFIPGLYTIWQYRYDPRWKERACVCAQHLCQIVLQSVWWWCTITFYCILVHFSISLSFSISFLCMISAWLSLLMHHHNGILECINCRSFIAEYL